MKRFNRKRYNEDDRSQRYTYTNRLRTKTSKRARNSQRSKNLTYSKYRNR